MSPTWIRRAVAVTLSSMLVGCGQLPGVGQGEGAPQAGAPQPGEVPALPGSVATEAPSLPTQAGTGQQQQYIGKVTHNGQELQYQVNATVTAVECGRPEIVEEYRRGVSPTVLPSSEGQFCVVRYDVENPTEVNGALSGGESLLVDPRGRAYTIDREATFLLASAERRVAGRVVPPGERASEALVFDVPGDFVPAQVQLRSTPEDPPLVVALAP